MVDIKYANAYREVLEILKYIPVEDYNKIPKNKIELFKINANSDYSFKYNPDKTLEEQKISETAKGIIAILFRDYWATEIQRKKIIAKQNYDRMKLEERKRAKYNRNNIFNRSNKITTMNNTENKQETSLLEINGMRWYKKIWDFLKKLKKKNNVIFLVSKNTLRNGSVFC